GVMSSSSVLGFGRLMQGSLSVRCIDDRACVGDSVERFLTAYDDDKGGLTGVFCKPPSPDQSARRVGQYFFLNEIVQGSTCPTPDYSLESRNPSTRTLVSVESGVVTRIERGPLHIIDF